MLLPEVSSDGGIGLVCNAGKVGRAPVAITY